MLIYFNIREEQDQEGQQRLVSLYLLETDV